MVQPSSLVAFAELTSSSRLAYSRPSRIVRSNLAIVHISH